MFKPSSIHPDVELRNVLQGQVSVGLPGGGSATVPVYGDWERPTNGVEDDFIVVMLNGGFSGVGMNANFAQGGIMVVLYSKLNDDGSVKKNRVEKILAQFETLVNDMSTENYYYKYNPQQFITPTTPNITSGYSVTSLNIDWHTTNNFNSK